MNTLFFMYTTMAYTKKDIRDLVDRANSLCYPGTTDGLVSPFGDCAIDTAEDVPIIIDKNSGVIVNSFKWARVQNQAEFNERFSAYKRFLSDFDFKSHGLVLAGGSVMAFLTRTFSNFYFDDFDFFLVGHSSDEARFAAVSALGDHLAASNEVVITRTAGAVTFSVFGIRYQVILRGYSTIAEVLHGFDIAACAAAFDGTTTWVTELGQFALSTACFPLRLDARRNSLEARIDKYIKRGFGLILLDLNVEKLLADYCGPTEGFIPSIGFKSPQRILGGYNIIACAEVYHTGHARPGSTLAHAYVYEDEEPLISSVRDILAGRFTSLVPSCIYHSGMDIGSITVCAEQVALAYGTYLRRYIDTVRKKLSTIALPGTLVLYDPSSIESTIMHGMERIRSMVIDSVPYRIRPVDEDTLIARDDRRPSELEWYGCDGFSA